MDFLKIIFKDTVIYSIVTFLGKFINYLLIPFLSRYICPSDFGIISTIYAYIAILNIIYNYGMEVTYFRFGQEKGKKIKTLILYTTIFFSILTFFIFQRLNFFPNYAIYIVLILVVDTLSLIPFAELKNNRNLKKYSFLKLLQTISNVVFIVLFLKFFHLETIKFYLISNILANIIILPFLTPFEIGKINKKDVYELLSFSLPLMFVNLIGEVNSKWMILSLDFFLPSDFYNDISKNTIIGMVSMNCKIATVIGICITSFRSAFDSMIFKKENDNVVVHQQTMHYLIIVISFIWFALSINRNLIAEIFFKNEIYKQGLIVIPFMGFYHICNGIYYTISIYFKKINKTIFNFIFAIASLLTNIILSMILIPHIGYIGSLIANISGISLAIILAYCGNSIKYKKKDIIWLIVPTVIMFIHDLFIKNFLITILVTFIYFCCVLFFLYKNDIKLRSFINSKKKDLIV